MDTDVNPFNVWDRLAGTERSRQYAHLQGWRTPPAECVVTGLSGERVFVISEDGQGDWWHHSHFYKLEVFDEVIEDDGDFDEQFYVRELGDYIKETYNLHYAKGNTQTFELIAKIPERGLNFTLGNVMKYADRFGQKAGKNRADLLKIAHYAILALHCYDSLPEVTDGKIDSRT